MGLLKNLRERFKCAINGPWRWAQRTIAVLAFILYFAAKHPARGPLVSDIVWQISFGVLVGSFIGLFVIAIPISRIGIRKFFNSIDASILQSGKCKFSIGLAENKQKELSKLSKYPFFNQLLYYKNTRIQNAPCDFDDNSEPDPQPAKIKYEFCLKDLFFNEKIWAILSS